MLNITVKATDGNEEIVSGNQVLISIGRKPNTEGIDTIGIGKQIEDLS